MSTPAENPQGPLPRPFPGDIDPTQSMELVWQGQRGDRGAVNDLFTRYIPRLTRILRYRIPPSLRTKVDPEDVLQETLIVATRRLGDLEIRSQKSILQWLAKIAEYEINNRLEYLQADKRSAAHEEPLRVQDDSADFGTIVPSLDPTPSQFYARDEMDEIVNRELRTLEPPEYREAILMRDYYDADWETMRTNLQRPSIEAVQDLYQRAHRRWKERIAKYLA
jgi:DNA-directed RNA polymerase specialized sigma24 family protein